MDRNPQIEIMNVLSEELSATSDDLSARLELPEEDVSKALAELVRRGLVIKSQDSVGSRALFAPSSKGILASRSKRAAL